MNRKIKDIYLIRKYNNQIIKSTSTIKGITLITLVVTIVIILILASATLNMVLGNGGIIEKSKIAVEEYKKAEVTEKKDIEKMENLLKTNLDELENGNNVIGDEELENLKKKVAELNDQVNGLKAEKEKLQEELDNKNKELESKKSAIKIGEDLKSNVDQTIDISNINDYQNLNEDNFVVVFKGFLWSYTAYYDDYSIMSKEYNNLTGKITLGKAITAWSDGKSSWFNYDVYII